MRPLHLTPLLRPPLTAVYFVQGILGLSRLAVSFYFKDELHIDPAQVIRRCGGTAAPHVSSHCTPQTSPPITTHREKDVRWIGLPYNNRCSPYMPCPLILAPRRATPLPLPLQKCVCVRPRIQVAVLTGLSGIPWMIKPVYGFISDSVPLFGYRRRSYLVLCGLMGG